MNNEAGLGFPGVVFQAIGAEKLLFFAWLKRSVGSIIFAELWGGA